MDRGHWKLRIAPLAGIRSTWTWCLTSRPFVCVCLQDPLGLSADGDVDKFNRYRAVEIKHGRGECPEPGYAPTWVGWLVLGGGDPGADGGLLLA